MATEVIKTYTAGDTAPPFARTAADGLNLTGLTGYTIRLRIRRPDGVVVVKTITTVLSADGQITDAAAGDFNFLFTATDLVAGILQPAEIEYEDGAGLIQTESPMFFSVKEALG